MTGKSFLPAGDRKGFLRLKITKSFFKTEFLSFLAVLSAEGIVPKLIWTKRMENGDVITAQECLNGREFKPEEMTRDGVAKLLKKYMSPPRFYLCLGVSEKHRANRR